ncbi:MAG: hypothetical protein L3K08_08395, partial [Thermoplasmata archaeon]|nr:hypothetical protein [Thermoplasmata archaeon]
MRGLRPFGLVLLYIGAQLVALALAFPFLNAGLSSTSNPNNPTNELWIIGVIVVAPLGILLVARYKGALQTLRLVLLLAIAASLDVTFTAALGLVLPAPQFLMPYGAELVFDAAVPLAAIIAIGGFLALLLEPQWYVVDTVGFGAGASLTARLGIPFGSLPCFLLRG